MITRRLSKKAELATQISVSCVQNPNVSESSSLQTSTDIVNQVSVSLSEAEEHVVWVQCDHKHCQKWRKLPHSTNIDVAEEWYCSMHPDPSKQSCVLPEEKCNISGEKYFTFTWYTAGDLVWAKMIGYPFWPSVVSPDPWSDSGHCSIEPDAEGCIYHIEFLGRPRSHIWLPETQTNVASWIQIISFRSHEHPFPVHKATKRLICALEEAETLHHLTYDQRLKHCQYRKDLILTTGLEDCRERKHSKHDDLNKSYRKRKASKHKQCSLTAKKKEDNHTSASDTDMSSTTSHYPTTGASTTSHYPTTGASTTSHYPTTGATDSNVFLHSTAFHFNSQVFVDTFNGAQPLLSYCKETSESICSPDTSPLCDSGAKGHQVDSLCQPGTKITMKQNVLSETDADTLHLIESNILNEWKEIESLCTVSGLTKDTTLNLDSLVNELHLIEDLFKL